MFYRFNRTVRTALYGALAVAAWQPAAAEVYTFEATITFCTGICTPFAALGAPTGGVGNTNPSDVTGFIEIDVQPNGSFTEADIIDFEFEVFNSAVATVDPIFVGDTFDNATEANPLPLDNRVVTFDVVPGFPFVGAVFGGSGTTGPNNELTSGQLVATFTQEPFNTNGAQIFFDLSNTTLTDGFLFGGVVLFTQIDGLFSQLPGEIDVMPNPLDFADTAIAAGSLETVTVTNTGGGPLTLGSVAGVNPLAAPFSITTDGCSDTTLASQASCAIDITFAPTVAGDFADSFDIVSDDPDAASVTVNVTGTGLAPNIQITPANMLTFVTTTVGETSQRTATVTNTGLADLLIGTVDVAMLDSQFSVALDNCSLVTLAAGATCTVSFEFAPEAEGVFSSPIVIPSNDPDTPSLNYTIQGEGIIGTIAGIGVDPGALVFDEVLVGEMAELAITVESTGNDPLELTSFTLSGADAAEFSETNDCPASLDSGSTCTTTIVFTPLTGGAKMAVLTIESNGFIRPVLDIDITATAFGGPRIEVDPAAVEFGSMAAPVDIGATATADLTVSNTGTEDLAVGQLTISGMDAAEFFVDSNGCTAPVPRQESCTVTLGFAPLTDADKAAKLSIESDDADNPTVSVDLTGFVFRGPRVGVPFGSIDIDEGASVEIGETTDFDLIVTNTGTEDLEITGFALGGANASEFSFTETCVGTPVAPQGTCTVSITFTPESAGEKTAELSIFSNDVTLVRAQTIVVTLTATAVAPPPPPPPAPPGSQTVQPPDFALSDPGGGATGPWLLLLGLATWLLRRRLRAYR